MKQFKLRASAAGKLAPEPKKTVKKYYLYGVEVTTAKYNKFLDNLIASSNYEDAKHTKVETVDTEEKLAETAKTYLKEWVISQLYGVEKQIKSKYIDKGIEMEDQAIDFAVKMLDIGFALKNEQRFEDDYFTGEPDMILDDRIIDIKNSWDCFTFPLFETEVPNSDYEYQLQVYMHLTGKRKATLVYVLLDTPATNWDAGIMYQVEDKLRIKTFEVEYDPAIIEALQAKVIEARNYINSLI